MKNREQLQLDKHVLACIMEWSQEDKATQEQSSESKDYELIQNDINSVDEGDGGFSATAIIKNIKTNKFFALDYEEWDYDWEKGDFENYKPELIEVFPKQITTTIYE